MMSRLLRVFRGEKRMRKWHDVCKKKKISTCQLLQAPAIRKMAEKRKVRGQILLISVDQSIDWLIDWLSEWVSEWVIYWLIDWLIDGLIDWVSGWVSDRLIDWLVDWSMGVFQLLSHRLYAQQIYFVIFFIKSFYDVQGGIFCMDRSLFQACLMILTISPRMMMIF